MSARAWQAPGARAARPLPCGPDLPRHDARADTVSARASAVKNPSAAIARVRPVRPARPFRPQPERAPRHEGRQHRNRSASAAFDGIRPRAQRIETVMRPQGRLSACAPSRPCAASVSRLRTRSMIRARRRLHRGFGTCAQAASRGGRPASISSAAPPSQPSQRIWPARARPATTTANSQRMRGQARDKRQNQPQRHTVERVDIRGQTGNSAVPHASGRVAWNGSRSRLQAAATAGFQAHAAWRHGSACARHSARRCAPAPGSESRRTGGTRRTPRPCQAPPAAAAVMNQPDKPQQQPPP